MIVVGGKVRDTGRSAVDLPCRASRCADGLGCGLFTFCIFFWAGASWGASCANVVASATMVCAGFQIHAIHAALFESLAADTTLVFAQEVGAAIRVDQTLGVWVEITRGRSSQPSSDQHNRYNPSKQHGFYSKSDGCDAYSSLRRTSQGTSDSGVDCAMTRPTTPAIKAAPPTPTPTCPTVRNVFPSRANP